MSIEKILVSACLMGEPCRWHGRKLPVSSFIRQYKKAHPDHKLIPICPELSAGLPTPRPPVKRIRLRIFETCENKENRKNITGREVTNLFVIGANHVLEIAKSENINKAILCKWSPSCDKQGITGKLLSYNGIEIINTF